MRFKIELLSPLMVRRHGACPKPCWRTSGNLRPLRIPRSSICLIPTAHSLFSSHRTLTSCQLEWTLLLQTEFEMHLAQIQLT